jgi:hypothetical protein
MKPSSALAMTASVAPRAVPPSKQNAHDARRLFLDDRALVHLRPRVCGCLLV